VLSPSGLSGAAVRHTLSDRLGAFTTPPETPIGHAGPGVRIQLHDFEAQPLAPFFPGSAEITAEADQKLSVSAWRDGAGCLYFAPAPLAAIERTLCDFPGVLDAFVAVPAEGGSPAAWVVLADGSTNHPAGLRDQLGSQVQFLLAVSAFPLSAAGEIDLAALPRPQVAPVPVPAGAAPRIPETPAREWTPLSPLNKNQDAPNLFLIHDIEGDPASYRSLAALLSADWSIYATTARGLHQPSACHTSIEAEAAALVEAICLLDPEGPYHLVGHGFGGVLAFEMARQMRVARREVPYLAIAGTKPPEQEEVKPTGWLQSITKAFRKPTKDAMENPEAGPVERAHQRALQAYRAKPLEGPAGVILGADQNEEIEDAWLDLLPETFIEHMSCNWREMLTEPSVKRLTVLLRDSFVAPGEDEE
jgi:surfactin synthase thioesterase subunit